VATVPGMTAVWQAILKLSDLKWQQSLIWFWFYSPGWAGCSRVAVSAPPASSGITLMWLPPAGSFIWAHPWLPLPGASVETRGQDYLLKEEGQGTEQKMFAWGQGSCQACDDDSSSQQYRMSSRMWHLQPSFSASNILVPLGCTSIPSFLLWTLKPSLSWGLCQRALLAGFDVNKNTNLTVGQPWVATWLHYTQLCGLGWVS
jgi:hypothetical protein